ncbi:DUF4429 domain-containing protein [Streptomyces sp. NPDC003077]|uniref:DUF4429 domain-containing protein n=1 Tax=Streptomyces sp. NPDC003077 TaxID=3154443 RepID=UPI0033BC3401
MGDVLAGFHAVWEFESDSVLIRFERGIRRPKLFQALGERRIPYEALSSVEVSEGRRGTVVLRATPRPGADPLMEAADGQLKEDSDPYRLVLPVERRLLAEFYADELRDALGPEAATPAPAHMVAAPEPPLHFKAYDGKASFDGSAVSFRWFWTGASSAKWKSGDQRFAVGELAGVEWRSPEIFNGHLRLVERGTEGQRNGAADQDPAAVVFGLGYGPVHESLPFAAAVLQAVRAEPVRNAPIRKPVRVAREVRRDAAEIADRIRQLGELHQAGLLTDDEFSTKKAELLAEL